VAGSVGGGDASTNSSQPEGMSETVSSSENRSPAAASISIGASCRGSELACSQVVEPSAESEGFVSSRGRCSELAAQIQLSHCVSVRNGAGTEDDQVSSDISSVTEQVIPCGNGGLPSKFQTKKVPRRFVLWHGWQQSKDGVRDRGDSDSEAEGFFQQLWHILWHPTHPKAAPPSIKKPPTPSRVPRLLVAAAVGEPSGVACLGVKSDQGNFSVPLCLVMPGRGGARGRGRGGTGGRSNGHSNRCNNNSNRCRR
jgi:hypothetical protein